VWLWDGVRVLLIVIPEHRFQQIGFIAKEGQVFRFVLLLELSPMLSLRERRKQV
jgi:hypothetical protein